jgi:hypothetical protein
MFIRAVDQGLERYLREVLPLPEETGDIAFETPTGNWSATLSRLTVNLFLYDISRAANSMHSSTRRVDENGKAERRPPQPVVDLNYLVSAWAGSPRDEHQLLGDVLNRLAAKSTLPPEHLTVPLSSNVQLVICEDQTNRAREIWTAAGGQLKASFTLRATVASDAVDWTELPPAVTAIEGMAKRRQKEPVE